MTETNGSSAAAASGDASMEPVEIVLPSSGGRTIRGTRYGCGKNASSSSPPPWIFLHGWLDNSASFELLIPELLSSSDGSADFFSTVVALDLLGHGKSDHRQSSYYMMDYAAEVLQCIDQLFDEGQEQFNILGHSLGAAVALLVAGTVPDRVQRLVLLESLGPWCMPADQAPKMFSKACSKLPSAGSLVTFESVEQAAETRAKKNVVPDPLFTAKHAAIVARDRGLKPVDGGGGYCWATDPWLLSPTRIYLTYAHVRAFFRACEAESLVLLSRDGILNYFFSTSGLSFEVWSIPFLFLVNIVLMLLSVVLMVLPSKHKMHSKLEKLQFGLQHLAWSGSNVRLLKRGTLRMMTTGGHHPQLTIPAKVAEELKDWIRATTK